MIYVEPERCRRQDFHSLVAYILRQDGGPGGAAFVLFARTAHIVTELQDAADEMQATADYALVRSRRGQRASRPAFHFILSWHPADRPEPEHMQQTAKSALATLGLAGHQAVIVGHNDQGHRHIHVAVNVIHPETGKAAKLGYRLRTMSRWAKDYELRVGVIRCAGRFVAEDRKPRQKRLRRSEWAARKKQKPDTWPGLRP